MKEVIHNVNTGYVEHSDVSSLLTLVCGRLFSDMRAWYNMPLTKNFPLALTLQFAQLFGSTVSQSLKRISNCGFVYYTRKDSFYAVPEFAIRVRDLPSINMPPSVCLQKEDCKLMLTFQQKFEQSVQQHSVR